MGCGSGELGYGLTVANWDRPDWYLDSAEEAMRLAEGIVARPSFSEETGIVEIPHMD